jgi:hypothetical protein
MVVWNLRDVKRDEIEKITKLVCKKILLKKKTRQRKFSINKFLFMKIRQHNTFIFSCNLI